MNDPEKFGHDYVTGVRDRMLYEYYDLNEGTGTREYTQFVRHTLASLEPWQRPGVCNLVMFIIDLQLTMALNLFAGEKWTIVNKEEARKAGVRDILADGNSKGLVYDLHGPNGWIKRFSVCTVDGPF
jgi:hypothetical protein